MHIYGVRAFCFCVVVALVACPLGMLQTSQASWEQSVLGADVSGSSRRMRITVTCPDRSVRVFLTQRDDYEAWLDALQKASSRRIEEHYGALGGGLMGGANLLPHPCCRGGWSERLLVASFFLFIMAGASNVRALGLHGTWTVAAFFVVIASLGLVGVPLFAYSWQHYSD